MDLSHDQSRPSLQALAPSLHAMLRALRYITSTAVRRMGIAKLTEAERADRLPALEGRGWALVDGRDAIHKVRPAPLSLGDGEEIEGARARESTAAPPAAEDVAVGAPQSEKETVGQAPWFSVFAPVRGSGSVPPDPCQDRVPCQNQDPCPFSKIPNRRARWKGCSAMPFLVH